MATAGDGATIYQSGGARLSLRKRLVRRSVHATPYDRPPTAVRNKSPSLSTLIYEESTGPIRVILKQLHSIGLRPSEIREVCTDKGGNLATEITEVESMLKQMRFTRYGNEDLVHAKTINSDGDEMMSMEDSTPTPTPSTESFPGIC